MFILFPYSNAKAFGFTYDSELVVEPSSKTQIECGLIDVSNLEVDVMQNFPLGSKNYPDKVWKLLSGISQKLDNEKILKTEEGEDFNVFEEHKSNKEYSRPRWSKAP